MITLANTITEAIQATGEIRAGGTDVQDRRRHHLSQGALVDISRIAGLNAITWREDGGANLGAQVTIDTVAQAKEIMAHYPGLALAAGALATPQIRRMASLGGSLLQRTRCWYFRHPDFDCFKGGGEGCPARTGDHRFGVYFDLGPCAFPHPSTLGMALLAYEAEVAINGQTWRPITAVYGDGTDPTRDHLLAPGELLTAVRLPPPVAHEGAAYFRAISRARAEWPLVEVVARLVVTAGIIHFARVGMGGVANIPLRLPAVEVALIGQPATAVTFAAAAETAAAGAHPLPMTQYKEKLIYGTVYETLQRAVGSTSATSAP